jgi:hypothetical protein
VRVIERSAVETLNQAADDDLRKCHHCNGKGWV